MTNDDAILFVQNLSRILARDNNATTAWEMYCSHHYNAVCLGIFGFVNATDEQKAEAMKYTTEAKLIFQ